MTTIKPFENLGELADCVQSLVDRYGRKAFVSLKIDALSRDEYIPFGFDEAETEDMTGGTEVVFAPREAS